MTCEPGGSPACGSELSRASNLAQEELFEVWTRLPSSTLQAAHRHLVALSPTPTTSPQFRTYNMTGGVRALHSSHHAMLY